MARFDKVGQVLLDNQGAPLVDGLIDFYLSGSTDNADRITTYADVNQDIPNPNPVVLSAAGRVPPIFFNGQANVVVRTAAGGQIEAKGTFPSLASTGDAFAGWSALITYDAADIVIASDDRYYLSIINGNLAQNPTTTTGKWQEIRFIDVYDAAETYQTGRIAIATDGNLYRSLVNSNLNNEPSISPTEWLVIASTGDVSGPASSTDNAIARFDLATGKLLQDSGVAIDDSDNIVTSGDGTFGATPLQIGATGGAARMQITAGAIGFFTSGDQRILALNLTTRDVVFDQDLAVTGDAIIGSSSVSPDGTLHVHTASAGAVTANGDADDSIVEGATVAGLSLLGADASYTSFYHGSPSSNSGAVSRWKFSTLSYELGSNRVGASTTLRGDAFVPNLTLSGAAAAELAQFVGDVEIAGANGLSFDAGANFMGQYDEDTYTATLTAGTSGTIAVDATLDQLSFIKIGKFVHVWGEIKVAAISSPLGALSLNLPSTSVDGAETSGVGGGNCLQFAINATTNGAWRVRVPEGSSSCQIVEPSTTAYDDNLANHMVANTTVLAFSFSYQEAA